MCIVLNPIPTGNGLNQPIYSYHVTEAGRNRVKTRKSKNKENITEEIRYMTAIVKKTRR